MTTRATAPVVPRDRRLEKSRRTLELVLDTLFRPASWAAKLAYVTRLSGRIELSTLEVSTGRVASEARPSLRVAFASDFHAGPTTDRRLLAEACELLAALEPDVVLLGGDYVSVRAAYIDDLAPLIARIPARLGKFGVLGNHDLRADYARVTRGLAAAGVRLLRNQSVRLEPPYDDMTICGLDDATRGRPDAETTFEGATATRIALMHSPDGLLSIGDRPFALALCGHTHGGQVVLPTGRAIYTPSGKLSRRYCQGVFDLGAGRTLLVTRGVGCSTLPVRAFAAPLVHLCLIS